MYGRVYFVKNINLTPKIYISKFNNVLLVFLYVLNK